MIKDFVTKYFWLFFIFGLSMGLFFPNVGLLLTPHLIYIFIMVMILTILRLDIKNISIEIKKPLLIFVVVIFILLIRPLLFYYVSKPLFGTEFLLAILVLCLMPAGNNISIYSSILKGNPSLAIILTSITLVLSPFTISFLISKLFLLNISINFFDIFIYLIKVIFIPIIIALIINKLWRGYVSKTKYYYNSV